MTRPKPRPIRPSRPLSVAASQPGTNHFPVAASTSNGSGAVHVPHSTGGIAGGGTYVNVPVGEPSVGLWLPELLALVGAARGRAVAAVADLLLRQQGVQVRAAYLLAADLLSPERERTCEAVVTLTNDGWDGKVGELIATARKL